MREVVEPGEFDIMTGSSSVDLKSAVLTVEDTQTAVAESGRAE
jgi:hypothetical protein